MGVSINGTDERAHLFFSAPPTEGPLGHKPRRRWCARARGTWQEGEVSACARGKSKRYKCARARDTWQEVDTIYDSGAE